MDNTAIESFPPTHPLTVGLKTEWVRLVAVVVETVTLSDQQVEIERLGPGNRSPAPCAQAPIFGITEATEIRPRGGFRSPR